MFDIKKLEAEVATELATEKAAAAKAKIKNALKYIADAKSVVRTLEDEYAVLLKDIGA